MKKLMFIFGTRPEFIKVYPIIIEALLQKNEVVIINTGQHREMLDDLLVQFPLKIDYNLAIMGKSNGLADIIANSIREIDSIIKVEKPDVVLVHGDTSTTLTGAFAAFYNKTPLAHIEAGLRTYDMDSPFPEESNRQVVGLLAKYHFAPTEASRQNLLCEGKPSEDIYVVGNSAIDMLKYTIKPEYTHPLLEWTGDSKLVLITVHRRENLGILEGIFKAINTIAEHHTDCKFIYPIHMNPLIREKADKYLNSPNIKIIEPLGTVDFHNIMRHTHLILTDSGGIQEEAPSLGVPVLVLRDTTERPEGVLAGTVKLIGTEHDKIITEVQSILENKAEYAAMQGAKNPYGTGKTAAAIIGILNQDK